MSRALALGVWAVLAALPLACELLALADRRRFAGFAELTGRLSSTPLGRTLLLLGWMWLGWHFFAR